MTSNFEWLQSLAVDNPAKLAEWFEAPHADESAACVTKTPEMLEVEGVDNSDKLTAHLKKEPVLTEVCTESVDGFTDSREKLEADVREYYRIGLPGIQETELNRLYYEQVLEWLNRQVDIRDREFVQQYCAECETAENAALKDDIATLREELAKRDKGIERLKARRDELQETCNMLAVESDDLEADRDDWRGKCEEATAKVDKLTIELENAGKLQQQVDNLAYDLAESERLREEMREELGVAYDYAHDLLARRDRGLA